MSLRVVVMCDRCPSEATREASLVEKGWSAHLVSLGPSTHKSIDLCPSCTRSFRLWLLREDTARAAHLVVSSGAV